MTGTAITEEQEFRDIYSMDVVTIPTNRPKLRKDLDDRVYKTKKEKYAAIVAAVEKAHKKGQPVLVGTTTIDVYQARDRTPCSECKKSGKRSGDRGRCRKIRCCDHRH